jgi:2'-5' RNA ligase
MTHDSNNRLLEIVGAVRHGRWSEIPRRWRQVTASGDWFAPSYGIPEDVKEQIHEWGKQLPWDSSAKLQDPSKYHITSFYSQNGYSDPSHHQWVQGESGLRYPAYTHSLDAFTGHDPGGLKPVVMRFHAPELSAHAESLMDGAEQRGLPVSRFEGGHKPHITLGHNPEGFPVKAPHIEFETEPMHELHSYYDSLKG